KFVRRHKAKLAVAAGLLVAVTLLAGTIGWAVRDRAARAAEKEREEIARRASGAVEVRDSLKLARVLIAGKKLAAARQKLAEARAQLGNEGSSLGDLATEVEASEAELDRFQRFLDLIERAHAADRWFAEAEAGVGPQRHAETLRTMSVRKRQPEARVPLVLQALKQFDVLGREDW